MTLEEAITGRSLEVAWAAFTKRSEDVTNDLLTREIYSDWTPDSESWASFSKPMDELINGFRDLFVYGCMFQNRLPKTSTFDSAFHECFDEILWSFKENGNRLKDLHAEATEYAEEIEFELSWTNCQD
jgi:hypothetical protein